MELWVWYNRARERRPTRRVPLPVGVRLVVGRSPDADVPVPSLALGRRHFEVRRDDTGVWVTDLDSRSGTWVNDAQIRGPTLLKPCDSIQHADLEVRVVPVKEVNPAWLRWNDGTVPRLAQVIYEGRRFDDLPILHDALLDAGCDNQDILDHLRSPGPHVRGCWVIDLILGKEEGVTDTGPDGVVLRLLVVKTRQVDRARLFYQAFGIHLIEERHGGGPVHYAGQAGVTTIEVYPWSEGGPAPDASVRLGFDVTDLDRVVESLRGLGTPVIMEPRMTPWGYRAVVRDPDGRAVELYGKGEDG
jgi:predicted enzyme related to lactoylglutathione lyase